MTEEIVVEEIAAEETAEVEETAGVERLAVGTENMIETAGIVGVVGVAEMGKMVVVVSHGVHVRPGVTEGKSGNVDFLTCAGRTD